MSRRIRTILRTSRFLSLSRPAQLNLDAWAKHCLLAAIKDGKCVQHPFSLEPIVCFANKYKITLDMKEYTHFWLHWKLVSDALSDMKILWQAQFDKIGWQYVHGALEGVPRMFQIWACKQVLGIVNTYGTVHKWDKSVDPPCPSCWQVVESTEHILFCLEVGRVLVFLKTMDLLNTWLKRMDTAPDLRRCIVTFCRRRGFTSMKEACQGCLYYFQWMALSQDGIGWQRMLEGMISWHIIEIQRIYENHAPIV